MFKNRICACMYSKNPEMDNVFKKFEMFFDEDYSKRSLDWVISKPGNKILQYTEQSPIHWNGTLAYWQAFASMFKKYNVEVYHELEAREIVIVISDMDSYISVIIDFNI